MTSSMSESRPSLVRSGLVVAAVALALGACVDRLPAQDRRILAATAVAKLSVEDLARDYQRDAAAANKLYWGKPIEVSGIVASTRDEQAGATLVFADKSGAAIVEAGLLEDQAKAILASTADHHRITLRCYCGGLNGRVQLKSCVAK